MGRAATPLRVICFFTLALLAPALAAQAQVPLQVHYQGHLTTSAGAPVNTPTTLTFRLYDSEGAATALWEETHANVPVTNGAFRVMLGSKSALSLPVFDSARWLGVQAGADAEMTPRQQLGAAPFALQAQSLASGATVQGSQITGAITTATVAGSQVTGTITGATLSGGTLEQMDERFLRSQHAIFTAVDSGASLDTVSIAVPADGEPVISYRDSSNSRLKVAKCSNPACTSSTRTPVDIAAGDAGYYSSIAIGADGLPIVSYMTFSGLHLKTAKCVVPDCSSGSVINIVDTRSGAEQFTSIEVPADGLPVIAYYNNGFRDLMVAKCGDAACSAGNVITAVDTAGDVGAYASLAIGADGLPVIAYWEGNLQDLKVAKCGNAACSGTPEPNIITSVDTGGNVGNYASIAVPPDGLPVIAYFDNTNGDLKVAKCGDAACSAGNSFTIVDTDGGIFTSIIIGPGGFPIVSYVAGGALKVAKCGNAACSSGNKFEVVDTFGGENSIAIGTDAVPIIAYSSGGLKTAKCTLESCARPQSIDGTRIAGALTTATIAGTQITGTIGAGQIGAGTITDSHVSTVAAIAESKLAIRAGFLSGRINNLATSGGTQFGGASAFTSATATESDVQTLSPGAPCTARNLSVLLTAAPGSGNSREFTLRDDSAGTALTCAISSFATGCTSSSSASVAAASRIALQIVNSGTPSAASALFGWECR